MRHIFQDVPGKTSGAGLRTNPLYRVEQVVKPPEGGAHRSKLNALGYPFASFDDAAFRTTRISRTIFALQEDTALWNKIDALFVRTGTLDGNFVNLKTGKTNASRHGAVTRRDYGVRTGGSSGDYIDMQMAANQSAFALNGAHIFAYYESVSADPLAAVRLIGRTSGNDVLRITPHGEAGSTTAANCRLNSTTSVGVNPYENVDRRGMWMVQRGPSDLIQLLHNDVVIASDNHPATEMPGGIAIGRNSTGHFDVGVSCFGFGGYLFAGERARLKAILDAHLLIV